MKNNLKFICFFAVRTLLVTLISLFIYAIFLHFAGAGNLIYYKGIKIILITFIVLTVIIFLKKNNFHVNFPALCLATILTYSFHITIPVILDRSISIQIIGSLKNQPMKVEDLNNAFLVGYVDKYSVTCRRLDEQLKTGNIIIENGTVSLTNKGKTMQAIFNKIAEFLKVEDHYIKGNLDMNYRHHYDLKNGQCVQSDLVL